MSKKIVLHIENFSFDAIIGILDSEKIVAQPVHVKAKFLIKYENNKLVDYAKIYDVIKNNIQNGKFLTIENALLKTSKKIHKKFKKIKKIKIKMTKPNALKNAEAGATFSKKY